MASKLKVKQIKMVVDLAAVSWDYPTGTILNVPEQIDHKTATAWVKGGLAVFLSDDGTESQVLATGTSAVLPGSSPRGPTS